MTNQALALVSDINSAVIATIESSNNPNAVGRAGERGLMQILNKRIWDEIVNDIGNQNWTWEDHAFEGRINRFVGNHYINVMIPRMLRRYRIPDTIETRIASYNWGIGRVRDAYRTHNENWLEHAPRVTRNYIERYKRGQ